jgi:hypothetical protein
LEASLPAPILIPALKAYGDFVIALTSTRRVQRDARHPRPVILAGRHLEPLAAALAVDSDVRFIGDSAWTDVPAAFDVGKRGKVAAMRSLLDLRRRFDRLERSTLLFDHMGMRECFIGARHVRVALPRRSRNIYLDYAQVFEDLGHGVAADPPLQAPRRPRRAVIVPGSRIDRKILPADTIATIHARLAAAAIDAQVLLLEQELVEVPPHVPSSTLPRRFDVLSAALGDADLVISADSLAAHLAEFRRRPSFVVSRVENPYWLPRSAYLCGAHATFGDLRPLDAWLERQANAGVAAA